jgi:isopentenyldiphosphate isomerase
LKLLQERIEKTQEHIGIGNNFLDKTPIAQQIRYRIDKWDCIKLKNFCTAKETVTRMKRQPTESEKISSSYTSDKELITKIHRELKKSKFPKPQPPNA